MKEEVAMAKKRARSRTTAGTSRRKSESHLFAVSVPDVPLNKAQVHRIASQIRDVTTRELLRMDFLIEDLKIPPGGKISGTGCEGCG
jgi:hypothetical protein